MIVLEHKFLRAVWTPVLAIMLQLCYSNVARVEVRLVWTRICMYLYVCVYIVFFFFDNSRFLFFLGCIEINSPRISSDVIQTKNDDTWKIDVNFKFMISLGYSLNFNFHYDDVSHRTENSTIPFIILLRLSPKFFIIVSLLYKKKKTIKA
jgi:hypothetical protein